MHATHAFEHVSEIQSYVEQKIAILEANLRMPEINLMEAYKEINHWRELYWDLQSRVIPMLVLASHVEHNLHILVLNPLQAIKDLEDIRAVDIVDPGASTVKLGLLVH